MTALVEPAWLTDEHLSADLRRVRAGLGATGDPPEVSRTAVLRTLESDLVGKLRADGVPEEDLELCTTMLLERYESWFGFLFTTRHTRVPVPDFPLTVVAGADSPAGGPPGAPPGRTTVVRLPIERAAVPRSPLTAAALLDLVVPTR